MKDSRDVPDWALEILDPDPENDEGRFDIPDRHEIHRLLVKYFTSPITAHVVERVEADFVKVRSSPIDLALHARYLDDSAQWRGAFWYEDIVEYRDSTSMTCSDLVLMLADILAQQDPSFPRPRPYCPRLCVGTWQQMAPRVTAGTQWLWEFASDGTFRCDNPEIPVARWCAHRHHGIGFDLLLRSQQSRRPWMIVGIGFHATDLTGHHPDPPRRTQFRLQRVSPRCSTGASPRGADRAT